MSSLRILIARPDRIGDVVLSTAIPREVKREYPDSYVVMLVREQTKDIFLHNPLVNEVITLDENGVEKSFSHLLMEIRSFSFTHAFMLLPNERINWLLFLSSIPNRVGVGHKLYQFLAFTKYVDRKKYIENRHESDYCLDMIRKLGIEPRSIVPEIYLSDAEKQEAENFRRSISSEKKIIGINTTSGGSTANLPLTEYSQLIKKLSAMKNIQVVVTDYNVPEQIENIPGVLFPVKNTSLRKLIKVVATLDILISASTGPMHVAAALKIPTLSVFCPLPACSPNLWGPLGNKSEVILPEANYCSNVCPGDPKKCAFEGAGGINHKNILTSLNKIFPELRINAESIL